MHLGILLSRGIKKALGFLDEMTVSKSGSNRQELFDTRCLVSISENSFFDLGSYSQWKTFGFRTTPSQLVAIHS
jgi:hypothetical protein